MDKISSQKERILTFLTQRGIKKAQFYKEMGFSEANFKGVGLKSELGGEKLAKILTYYPELSAEWLITGVGEMLKTKCKTNNNELTGTLPEASPSTAPQGNDALCKGRKTLEEVQPSEEKNPYFEALIDRIVQMTEEICRLKSRIDQLEHRTE